MDDLFGKVLKWSAYCTITGFVVTKGVIPGILLLLSLIDQVMKFL